MSKAVSVSQSEGHPVAAMVRLPRFRCRSAGLGLLQCPENLFFSESLPLHAEFSLVFLPENSLSKWTVLWGERQLQHQTPPSRVSNPDERCPSELLTCS